jgi:hypothetical protein
LQDELCLQKISVFCRNQKKSAKISLISAVWRTSAVKNKNLPGKGLCPRRIQRISADLKLIYAKPVTFY